MDKIESNLREIRELGDKIEAAERAEGDRQAKAQAQMLEDLKQKTDVADAIRELGGLADNQFALFLRWLRRERPAFWSDPDWEKAVKLELDLRMLLK